MSPDGEISLVAEGINQPNGLAFSPDEKILYVVESRGEPRKILALDVIDGIALTKQRVFIDAGPKGTPDGFRVDVMAISGAAGVWVKRDWTEYIYSMPKVH